MINNLARPFATTFYSGYSKFAPGTVGAAIALIPVLLIPGFQEISLLITIVCTFFLGVWSATIVEKTEGDDASIITIDEVVGMWISLLYLPIQLTWLWLLAAFLIFRIFDIIKPYPANRAENFPGGWGVMLDDVFAGIYTNLLIRLILIFLSFF